MHTPQSSTNTNASAHQPANAPSVSALVMQHADKDAYRSALATTLIHLEHYPNDLQTWVDAILCYSRLEDWPNAIRCARKTLELNPNVISAMDALAHANCINLNLTQAQHYGCLSLEARDRDTKHVVVRGDWMPKPVRALNTHEPDRNVIAFSLFGDSSKYCESAIFNAEDQKQHYPHWRCWFYVDGSVPDVVKQRIAHAGGKIIEVSSAIRHWPGAMWRFAAYDAPNVDRVIFRDTDSVLNAREAGAVTAWGHSGRRFHVMRDAGSHTELILAGMWGITAGAIPPMSELVAHFLQSPVESAHFADQAFLRHYVWNHAKVSLCHHDSLFGFCHGNPFPEGPYRADFQVGNAESNYRFNFDTQHPVGSTVPWSIMKQTSDGQPDLPICTYASTVSPTQKVSGYIPERYMPAMGTGEMYLSIGL